MRNTLITAAMAAVVATGGAATVVSPAYAASPDQLIRLAQNNSGPNLFNLYQQIQELQQQVRELNGQVDTLQYKLRQSEQGQRELYENLDKRLSKLESNSAAGANEMTSGESAAGTADVDPQTQSAYMDGFDKLKNGQYDAAIAAFKQFVSDHPESGLTDNAWYWLGETYYVQQDLDNARQAFETVVNRFGNSPKLAAALYKIGLIQIAQNETDNARAMLQRVVDQYPDSDSADLARQKLQSLDNG